MGDLGILGEDLNRDEESMTKWKVFNLFCYNTGIKYHAYCLFSNHRMIIFQNKQLYLYQIIFHVRRRSEYTENKRSIEIICNARMSFLHVFY
jgi:hypothetical protein